MTDRIGAIGYLRSGELALLLAAIHDDIHAVVSYVGSSYTHRAVTTTGIKVRAAWTYQGQPLPFR